MQKCHPQSIVLAEPILSQRTGFYKIKLWNKNIKEKHQEFQEFTLRTIATDFRKKPLNKTTFTKAVYVLCPEDSSIYLLRMCTFGVIFIWRGNLHLILSTLVVNSFPSGKTHFPLDKFFALSLSPHYQNKLIFTINFFFMKFFSARGSDKLSNLDEVKNCLSLPYSRVSSMGSLRIWVLGFILVLCRPSGTQLPSDAFYYLVELMGCKLPRSLQQTLSVLPQAFPAVTEVGKERRVGSLLQ